MQTLLKTLVFLLLLVSSGGGEQLWGQQYYIYFTDKPSCEDVASYYDAKALARRAKHGIPFPQPTDLPLDPAYTAAVADLVDTLRTELWWWNAVSVSAQCDQMEAVERLPFVSRIEAIDPPLIQLASDTHWVPMTLGNREKDTTYFHQRNLLGLDRFVQEGLDGKGVRIAVFDAGFSGADEHPGLAHLFEEGRVLGTRDFQGKDDKVFHGSEHGTAVLSCIAGYYGPDRRPLGAAPGAEFLLARTEHRWFEKISEEDYWLAAAEWADREGADIISSSLGYDKKRYTYADMDGQSTKVSRAAAMAVRKGILVVNSAGNSGSGKFHYLSAPGDADSVLTVGASFPMMAYPMQFSAFGPNYKGRIKPDVSAPGYVLACDKKGEYDLFAGTSFACPLIAGFAACMLQLDPEQSNLDLHRRIRSLGHWTPYYDYRLGHGVPNANWIWDRRPFPKRTFEVFSRNDSFFVFVDSLALHKDLGPNGKPLHYSLVLPNDSLNYATNIRLMRGQTGFVLPAGERPKGKLRIWFEGFLWEERRFP